MALTMKGMMEASATRKPRIALTSEDGTGFEVERAVEKDGKRREKDEKGREKDEKGWEKDEKRGKYSDYLSIQYRYRRGFRQIG